MHVYIAFSRRCSVKHFKMSSTYLLYVQMESDMSSLFGSEQWNAFHPCRNTTDFLHEVMQVD